MDSLFPYQTVGLPHVVFRIRQLSHQFKRVVDASSAEYACHAAAYSLMLLLAPPFFSTEIFFLPARLFLLISVFGSPNGKCLPVPSHCGCAFFGTPFSLCLKFGGEPPPQHGTPLPLVSSQSFKKPAYSPQPNCPWLLMVFHSCFSPMRSGERQPTPFFFFPPFKGPPPFLKRPSQPQALCFSFPQEDPPPGSISVQIGLSRLSLPFPPLLFVLPPGKTPSPLSFPANESPRPLRFFPFLSL